MAVQIENANGVVIASPQYKRIDVKSVGDFKDEILELAVEGSRVILDMGNVDFVDSTGLSALLSLLRGLAEKGGQLRLAALQEQVIAMFRLVRMYKVFDIYETREEAGSGWLDS